VRALALVALLALHPADLLAQGRSRRHRRPPRAPTAAINLRVLRVERASTEGARLAAPTVLPAVARCLDAARADDPAGLPTVRSIDVVIGLAAGGRAQAVEFDPPLLARGLSACLGGALLTWRQPGTTRPRASVYLRLEL
jgi:hypothetical protein